MPKYAAWPSEARPVKPSKMSRLSARIAKAMARVARRTTNEPERGTMNAIRTSAAITPRTLSMRGFIRSLPSEQSGRFDREDQNHRCIQGEIRKLREQRLAEIIGEAHGESADGRAAKA